MVYDLFRLRNFRAGSRLRSRKSLRPSVELMEGRALLTIAFNSVAGIGAGQIHPGRNAIDAAGNTYVTGDYTGTVDFSGGANSSLGTKNAGNTANIFVAKYSPSGSLLWVDDFADVENLRLGASSGSGLAVDGAGNVYVTGTYAGRVNFSPSALTADFRTATTQDIFVLKLSGADGSKQAVRTYGGSGKDAGLEIDVDASGQNVVLTGYYQGSVNFTDNGSNNSSQILSSAAGVTTSAFVLSLNNSLKINWVQRLASGVEAIGTGLGVDGSGNVYVVGTNTVGGVSTEFIEKRDAGGGFVAGATFGRVPTFPIANFLETPSIAVASNGDLYISGNFQGTGIDFDPSAGTSTMDSSNGTMDIFVVKLNSSLGLVWKTRFGGSLTDGSTNISDLHGGIGIDGAGNVYLGGSFTAAASVGTATGTAVLFPANSGSTVPNAFIARFEAATGNFIEARAAGSAGQVLVFGVSVNPAGQIALDGAYSTTTQFGTLTANQLSSLNMFVANAKVGEDPPPSSTAAAVAAATPPVFAGVSRSVEVVVTGKGRRKKKTRVTYAVLRFSGPLDAASAQALGKYQVTQKIGRRNKKVGLKSVSYADNTIKVALGKFQAGKKFQLAASGLVGANGRAIAAISGATF